MKQITQTKSFSPTHLDISGGTYKSQTSNAATYLSTITSSSGNGIGTSVQSTVIIKDLKNQLPGIISSTNLNFGITFDAKKQSLFSSSAYIKFLLGRYVPNGNITNNTYPVFYNDIDKYYNIPTTNDVLHSFFYYWNGSSFSKASDSTPYSIDSESSFFIRSGSLSTSWKNNLSLELAQSVDPDYEHFAISFLIEEAYLRNVQLKVSYLVKCYEIGVSSNNTSYGTVSVDNNGQSIIVNGIGTAMTITASPQPGYIFKHWIDMSTGSIFSTNASQSFTPSSDKNYQAIFEPSSYTITAQPNNTSYGTVSNSGGTYSYNSTFTSTATPNTNYQFDGWYKDGNLVTSSAQLSVTVSGNATYTAQFSKKKYTITYESDGGTSTPDSQEFYAGDSVKLAPAIQKDSTTTNPSYDFSTNFYKQDGTWVNGATTINQIVYPKKETSYTFYRWRNGSTDYQAEGSYQLSGDITFTATWNQSHSYTITAPTVSRNNSIVSRIITFHYNDGTNTTSTATSSNTTSYTFKGWYDNTSGGNIKISSNGGSYHPSSGEILYAQWNSSSTGYNAVTFPAFSRDGYTLKGFSKTDSSKTVDYYPGDRVVVDSDEWYAVWEPDILTISLDNKNATTNGTSTLYLKYDTGWYSNSEATTQIMAITKPTKTGYTFKGYYTQENGTGDCIINSNGTPQSNIFTFSDTTLYAYWTINYYTLEDDINTNGSQGFYDGNIYSVTFISGDKIDNTYSYGSRIKLIATPNTEEGYNFSYWKINNSYETSQEYEYTIEKDTTITAYFNLGELSITINLYQEGNPNIFNIPMGQEKDYVKLWIRDYNNTSYDGWEQKPFNIKLSYANAKNIQIVIEDGKKYEFLSSDFTQYESIPVNQVLVYSVYFKEISEINSIYLGKSDKPYTSGYIKDPNLSFEEEISSIWVGNKQIMGKAPTRDYPYLEDTLLGNTLYIGKNNSFINSYRDNLNIYKVIVPEGILNTGGQGFFGCSNLTSIILPKSLKSIGQHVFEGTGLKSLYLPDQVETLSIRTLNDMYSLEKIVFPKNLKIIYANNASNSKVSTINLFKTNLEILKNGAFRGLSKLTTILLPNTLQSIEEEAFSSCYNLKKVIYKGTIEDWQNISIAVNKNEYLLNATIYCKDGIINPKEEN